MHHVVTYYDVTAVEEAGGFLHFSARKGSLLALKLVYHINLAQVEEYAEGPGNSMIVTYLTEDYDDGEEMPD